MITSMEGTTEDGAEAAKNATAGQVVAFFTTAFQTGLACGLVTPDDILRHATTDLLASLLPRQLLAKLLVACLAAPRMDAKLIVDVVTVRELCVHLPAHVLWACLAEAAQRALGDRAAIPVTIGAERSSAAMAAVASGPIATQVNATPIAATPMAAASNGAPTSNGAPSSGGVDPAPLGAPPHAAAKPGRTTQNIPMVRPPPAGVRPATSPIAGGTGAGAARPALTAANTVRRPQASSPATPGAGAAAARGRTTPPTPQRSSTGSDFDIDTDINTVSNLASGANLGNAPAAVPDWKARGEAEPLEALGVSDDDIVDWAQAEETITVGIDLERKR